MTIDNIYRNNWISKECYNICKNNDIITLKDLYDSYEEYGPVEFLSYLKKETGKELISLCIEYKVDCLLNDYLIISRRVQVSETQKKEIFHFIHTKTTQLSDYCQNYIFKNLYTWSEKRESLDGFIQYMAENLKKKIIPSRETEDSLYIYLESIKSFPSTIESFGAGKDRMSVYGSKVTQKESASSEGQLYTHQRISVISMFRLDRISAPTYYVCNSNDILTLNDLYDFYKKNGPDTHLKYSNSESDEELISLCVEYKITCIIQKDLGRDNLIQSSKDNKNLVSSLIHNKTSKLSFFWQFFLLKKICQSPQNTDSVDTFIRYISQELNKMPDLCQSYKDSLNNYLESIKVYYSLAANHEAYENDIIISGEPLSEIEDTTCSLDGISLKEKTIDPLSIHQKILIKRLYEKHWISEIAYSVCKYNNIATFEKLYQFYQSFGTIRRLKNCRKKTELEFISLCVCYQVGCLFNDNLKIIKLVQIPDIQKKLIFNAIREKTKDLFPFNQIFLFEYFCKKPNVMQPIDTVFNTISNRFKQHESHSQSLFDSMNNYFEALKGIFFKIVQLHDIDHEYPIRETIINSDKIDSLVSENHSKPGHTDILENHTNKFEIHNIIENKIFVPEKDNFVDDNIPKPELNKTIKYNVLSLDKHDVVDDNIPKPELNKNIKHNLLSLDKHDAIEDRLLKFQSLQIKDFYENNSINARSFNICNCSKLVTLKDLNDYYERHGSFNRLYNWSNGLEHEFIVLCIEFRLHCLLNENLKIDHSSKISESNEKAINDFIHEKTKALSYSSHYLLFKDLYIKSNLGESLDAFIKKITARLNSRTTVDQNSKDIIFNYLNSIKIFTYRIENIPIVEHTYPIFDSPSLDATVISTKETVCKDPVSVNTSSVRGSVDNASDILKEAKKYGSIFKFTDFLLQDNLLFSRKKTRFFKKAFLIYKDQAPISRETIENEFFLKASEIRQFKRICLEELCHKLSVIRIINEDLSNMYDLNVTEDQIIIDEKLVDVINEKNKTNFSRNFIAFLIFVYSGEQYDLIGDLNVVFDSSLRGGKSKRQLHNFYIIKKDIGFDFEVFYKKIYDLKNKSRSEKYSLYLKTCLVSLISADSNFNRADIKLSERLSPIAEDILCQEFGLFLDDDENIVFEKTTKVTIKEYAYHALISLGRYSTVDEIYEEVLKLYPDFEKDKSSLINMMRREQKFISSGVKNTYGLTEWIDELIYE